MVHSDLTDLAEYYAKHGDFTTTLDLNSVVLTILDSVMLYQEMKTKNTSF